jgi:hypothetical protein
MGHFFCLDFGVHLKEPPHPITVDNISRKPTVETGLIREDEIKTVMSFLNRPGIPGDSNS